MYTEYLNLKCKPFELLPDPEFLLLSRSHKRALVHLNYGIMENAGFILVTGEVGAGKTTIIRSMMRGLKEDIKLARINNTRVTSEQLISMINEEFGLEIKGKDKTTMLSELTNFLISQFSGGSKTVIIIDEAQNLSPDLFEEIRLLSNLETDKAKLLQIILVGQPEIVKTLAQPELRQLRQRISISCHIQPLSKEETVQYIFHRLEVAGNRDAVHFEEGSIDVIHMFSRGIPRLINIACDFLLLSSFVEQTKEISMDLVNEVIGELEATHGYWGDDVVAEGVPYTSKTDLLRDILDRLAKIESYHGKSDMSRSEKEDILLRLADVEKAVNESIINQPKAEKPDSKMAEYLKAVREVIEELTGRVVEIEDKMNVMKVNGNNKKRKAFWNRMLSHE